MVGVLKVCRGVEISSILGHYLDTNIFLRYLFYGKEQRIYQ